MATDSPKYLSEPEPETRHSALAEFSRDERRPAVLLLSALVIGVIFFGIGVLVGRWTATPAASTGGVLPNASPASASPISSPQPPLNNSSSANTNSSQRRFAILIATYDSAEKTKPLMQALQTAGYPEIRSTTPRAGDKPQRYSVIVGRYTQDEAREAVRRLRSSGEPRFQNARVIDANE